MAQIEESDVDAKISRFTVAFVLVDSGTPMPLGSGTLVRCRATQGILTCAHVLDAIKGQKQFGVMCFAIRSDKRQAIRYDVAATARFAVEFWTEAAKQDGPDIAFIPIPAVEFGKLLAISSVYDLDIGKDRAISPKPPTTAWEFEAVSGIVGEMTDPAVLRDNSLVLTGQGLVNAGQVVGKRKVNDIEMLVFQPIPGQNFPMPTNYEGTSGGGLWKLYLDQDRNVIESRLSGVAFYQRPVNGVHCIDCHAPDGIYGLLLAEIYNRWQVS